MTHDDGVELQMPPGLTMNISDEELVLENVFGWKEWVLHGVMLFAVLLPVLPLGFTFATTFYMRAILSTIGVLVLLLNVPEKKVLRINRIANELTVDVLQASIRRSRIVFSLDHLDAIILEPHPKKVQTARLVIACNGEHMFYPVTAMYHEGGKMKLIATRIRKFTGIDDKME